PRPGRSGRSSASGARRSRRGRLGRGSGRREGRRGPSGRASPAGLGGCRHPSQLRPNLLVEIFVELFDLLMGLRLDARDVIPWAFEMGDDLIELQVKGRGVPVLRVLEDEYHQQGSDADSDVGLIAPE